MNLYDIKIGNKCKVINVNTDTMLKYKFMDLGIKKGTELFVQNISFSKANICVKVKNYTVALRDYEASVLQVTLI